MGMKVMVVVDLAVGMELAKWRGEDACTGEIEHKLGGVDRDDIMLFEFYYSFRNLTSRLSEKEERLHILKQGNYVWDEKATEQLSVWIAKSTCTQCLRGNPVPQEGWPLYS
jgi:hypothetical protein